MTDARFEDAAEQPLRLIAQDAEDLKMISTLLQDAVLPITEMTWAPKQRRFGLPVSVHAAVVVEVVLREIGENGDADVRAGQAVLGQTDGRGLDGAGARTGVDKLTQGALQPHRIGRGHASGFQRHRRALHQTHAQSTHQRAWDMRRQLTIQ